MNMDMIGKRIKKLRCEKDITQEKLAEYLNISPQAVSRWETGLAAPDISALPALANLFDVTTDFLLGVDIINKENAVKELLAQVSYIIDTRGLSGSNYSECVSLLRDGLKKYPHNPHLENRLGIFLFHNHFDEGTEEYNACVAEAIEICERIIATCNIDELRHSSISGLCYMYKETGKREKAIELAMKMPPASMSKDHLLTYVYEGSQRLDAIQIEIVRCWRTLTSDLKSLAFGKNDEGTSDYTIEERGMLLEKINAITEILLEERDFDKDGFSIYNYNIDTAKLYADMKNAEKVLHYIDIAVKGVITCLGYEKKDVKPSLVRRFYHPDGFIGDMKGAVPQNAFWTLQDLAHERFDFIREDERFKNMAAILQKHAEGYSE